jgi:hypothetical protein
MGDNLRVLLNWRMALDDAVGAFARLYPANGRNDAGGNANATTGDGVGLRPGQGFLSEEETREFLDLLASVNLAEVDDRRLVIIISNWLKAGGSIVTEEFAVGVTSTANLVAEGITDYPLAFALLGRLFPEVVSTGLTRAWAEELRPDRSEHRESAVIRDWRTSNEGEMPGPLGTAAAVADGVRFGEERLWETKMGRESYTEWPADPRSSLVAALAIITSPLMRPRPNQRDGMVAFLRELVTTDPDTWVDVLPWTLSLLGESYWAAKVTMWAVAAGADPAPVLRQLESDHHLGQVGLYASTLLTRIEGTADTQAALAELAMERDQFRSPFPMPLSAPTSTWLSANDVEERLRACVQMAAVRFADSFIPSGSSEEEGHVADLMGLLRSELAADHIIATVQHQSTPIELSGKLRTVRKHEEKTVAADLAIVVTADAMGAMEMKFVDFIQVKKSIRLNRPTSADAWEIAVDQLTLLLETSPTAVYWLIGANGKVRVLPAKVVRGVGRGRSKLGQGTFTLRYTDIRHPMIALDQYLVDLTVGGWLGSSTQATLDLALGSAETTMARHVFELHVGRTDN